ncbi:MAG: endopeptidase La [Clostridia bacterium]|nr:endopeptidase La [Clostridia bacterium]
MKEIFLSEQLPVLALRGLVVFPGMTTHFDVGREKSIKALEQAMSANQRIFLVTQKELLMDDPGLDDLYSFGTVCQVKQVLKMPGDVVRILVFGEYRALLVGLNGSKPYLTGMVEAVREATYRKSAHLEALIRQSYQLFEEFLDLSQQKPQESCLKLFTSTDPGFIADVIGQMGTFNYDRKMEIFSQFSPAKRLELANRILADELNVLRLENDLSDKVQHRMDKDQRDYYLREQLKVIHSELGEGDDENDADAYREKIRKLQCSAEVTEKLNKEVSRLTKQAFGSAEASVIRNYLDIALELPWGIYTKQTVDVAKARKILNQDHFGLDKVKERILEILAVKQMAPTMPGQIICLVGPPGVGKTSIAMSVARALNRKLARISLGGIHDEAEIRGHRKTYIGAMPGRILTAITNAKSCNPLLLLDEIDKVGNDYKGDPASALLEVLDSEQNATFRDNFLELPFDLSDCMFITTANTTDTIPKPLLDRMEVIELSSYTDEEKLQIAKSHLLPKQMNKHGLKKSQLRLTDEAIREIISCYTRESGVRNLEREIASVCRKADMKLVSDRSLSKITVRADDLHEFLGPKKITPDKLPSSDPVGLVTGLAWTQVGGETLEVECNVMDGTGKLELTGNLGEVMKESAQAAFSYIRAHWQELHVPADFYKIKDIHVHFPEGAVPKDGPSAGITVCTAMVSALSGAPVRRDVAMTGEISIRGRVLPIGGLKEKTMAALRHGVSTVIIPQDNEKDLDEIDQTVRQALNFVTVDHVSKVLSFVLDFSACEAQSRQFAAPKLEIPVAPKPKPVNKGLHQ